MFSAPPLRCLRPLQAVLFLTILIGSAVLIWSRSRRHGIRQWWDDATPNLEVLVRGGWWWGGLICVLLLGLLLITSGIWARQWAAARQAATSQESAPRWMMWIVILAMAAGAAVRVPRLDLSFYNDEAHAFRSHLAGSVPRAFNGDAEKFRPVKWMSTLYENRAGNNAMPFSIAARSSYDLWRKWKHQPPGVVSEWAVRLPVLCCGVLAIGAMGWLGLRLAGPGAGAMAVVLSAFHPWHMRYSVEARGYGMMLLAIPLLFLALHAALRTGRWRHWMAFGGMQYLTLACFFGASWFLAGLNLSLVFLAVLPWLRTRSGPLFQGSLLFPVLVAGTFAAGLYLLGNLPLYLQLSKALADPAFFKATGHFTSEWLRDTAGFLAFGMPGNPVEAGHPQPITAWGTGSPVWQTLTGLATAILTAGVGAGLYQQGRKASAGAALAGAVVLGALLTVVYCSIKHIAYLKWYSLFLLPGLLLLPACGFGGIRGHRPTLRWLLLLPIFAVWAPPLQYYMAHSRENLRAAVEVARGASYPQSLQHPSRSLYGVTWSESPVYDPSSITVTNAAKLEELIGLSRSSGRPLHISHGRRGMLLADSPEILAALENPDLFERVASLPGMDEAATTHFVYRLRP